MFRRLCLCLVLLPGLAAAAETELSFYGGAQSSPHSRVTVAGDGVIPDNSFLMGWEGDSFSAPPYYGIRVTRWTSDRFGWGVDFSHNKIYPVAADLPPLYDALEFTDGLNTLTLNAYRRWPEAFMGLNAYAGGGIGVSIPHVEVIYDGGASRTFEYQYTGPAVAWMVGASYPISPSWAVFGEYKGTYSLNEAQLDTGGTLSTDVVTNALNMGVSFNF